MFHRFARFTRWLFTAVVAWQLISGSPLLASVDHWASAVNGVWQNGANWLDGSTPGGGDTAFFNLAGAYTVSFNGTPVPIQALSVSDGTNATFTSTSIFDVSTLQITSAGDSEVLVTHGATLTLGTSGGIVNPDRALHLTAGDDTNLDDVLTVQTNATLNVAFGSDVYARGFVVILGGGQVNILGSGSTLTSVNSLYVGESGTGTLNVASGGQVVTLNMGRLGQQGNSEGYATVSGANSQWLISSGLEVGGSGDGTLMIQNGGSVAITGDDAPIAIGLNAGSNGTAIVTGAGSIWNADTTDLDVGYHGTGTLTIEAGGSVLNEFATIGREAGSIGNVTVTGAGSMWDANGFFDVGLGGEGTLTIEAGGSVSSGPTSIGYFDGSSGEVTVTGAGSTWTTGDLLVGREGDGILNIADGATVVLPFGSANVGTLTDTFATGLVAVDGLGSTFSVGGDLTIRFGGLRVFGGGVVSVGGVLSIERNGPFVSSVRGNGTLAGNLVVNRGLVLPGSSPSDLSSGALAVDGNYVQSNEGILGLGLGGTTPGLDYDQLQVTGQVTLDGRLDVVLVNPFTPSAGDTFDILDWGSLSGTFDNVFLPPLSADLVWNTTQLYVTGALKVGLAGDYNDDGTVDAADYIVWRKNLGTNYHLPNEAGFPGIVDQFDYDVWRANFGATIGSGSALGEPSQANVPEPAAVVLVCLAAAAVRRLRSNRVDSCAPWL